MCRAATVLSIVLAAWAASGVEAQEANVPTAPAATPGTATEQGVAAYRAGRLDEARTLFGKAVALDPTDAVAQAYLGLVLSRTGGDLDQAAAHLETAVKLDPRKADFHRWLGGLYSRQAQAASAFKAPGLARAARRELEAAVQMAPDDVDARFALLQFYLQAPGIVGGSDDKAREQALAITALDRYRGLLAQAIVAQHDDDLGRAEQLYRTAIAAFPREGEAYNQLGYLLLGAKRRAEAIDTFRAYVAARPDEANPHDSLAEGLLAAGKVDESIAEYQRALAIDGRFSSSYLGLASCYEKKGDWAKAREALERFLELVPGGRAADDARDRLERLAARTR